MRDQHRESNGLTRRDFLRAAGAGAALTLGGVALAGGLCADESANPAAAPLTGAVRKPNVILIFSDDHGYAEISCQGCKDVQTPHIDSIAANGVRFTDGYVTCPVCSPSRAGLLTGRYQQRFGHYTNTPPLEGRTKPWGLPLDQKIMPQYMKDLGYVTGAIGKWHLGEAKGYRPMERGFDEYFGFLGGLHGYLGAGTGWNAIQKNGVRYDEKEYLTDALGREAVSFIDRHKEKPFFLYVAFNAVHGPMQASPKDKDLFPEIKDPRRRTFAKMLKSMDNAVGAILAKVKAAGLEENTIIFFVGDNGGPTQSTTSSNHPLKGTKAQVHEGGIRVPFVAQWKGHIPAGEVCKQPVISLDVLPTILKAAGGSAPANADGVDLMPYLTGKNQGTPHEALYWLWHEQSAIRMWDWKLSRYENYDTRLYNLASDIGETTDLSEKHPEKVKELAAAWEKWHSGNVKPLWHGKEPQPDWVKGTW